SIIGIALTTPPLFRSAENSPANAPDLSCGPTHMHGGPCDFDRATPSQSRIGDIHLWPKAANIWDVPKSRLQGQYAFARGGHCMSGEAPFLFAALQKNRCLPRLGQASRPTSSKINGGNR